MNRQPVGATSEAHCAVWPRGGRPVSLQACRIIVAHSCLVDAGGGRRIRRGMNGGMRFAYCALHAAATIAITRSGASCLRSSRRDAPVLVTSWEIFIDHVLWIGIVGVGLGAGSAIVAVAGSSSGTGASRIGRGACIALNVARRAGTALRTRTGRGAGTAPTTAAAFSSSAAGARPSTRAAAASGPGAAATAPTVLG
jgi:hypothetical protein